MTISRVQYARGSSQNSTTVSVTLGSTPTNGNVLVATITALTYYTNYPSVLSISQTGVSWRKQVQSQHKPVSYEQWSTEIWLGVVGAGASTSITVTLANPGYFGAVANVCEYSGVATSNCLDQAAVNYGGSTNPDTGRTSITTQADELWIGAIGADWANPSLSNPSGGWQLLDGATAYTYLTAGYLEKIVSAVGQATVSVTNSAGSGSFCGCVATFKSYGGSGESITNPNSLGSAIGNMNFNSVLIPHAAAQINTQTAPVALELPTMYLPKETYTNLGHGNILFQDTTPPDATHIYPAGQNTSLFLVMVEDPKPEYAHQYNPILATDHGLWVEKDIQTYGALFTTTDPIKLARGEGGGGAILMGHGFSGPTDPPKIILTDSSYPTLHLRKSDSTPADMNLATITAHNVNPSDPDTYGCGGGSNYWLGVVTNTLYYKNVVYFGCAKELSDQVVDRKFETVEDAINLIKHETSKELHHIKYGHKDGTVVCTCGKDVDWSSGQPKVCPEHRAEWEDRYLLKTGDLIEATAYVIPRLLSRIEALEKRSAAINS